jgi:DNA-binding MarR family transcriptional regulator
MLTPSAQLTGSKNNNGRRTADWVGLRLVVLANHGMQPLYAELEARWRLSRDEAVVLVGLSQTSPSTAQQIAHSTGRSKNSISRGVVSLERRKLIRRQPHPADGRSWRLELTPAGRSLCEVIEPRFAAADERILEGLAEAERTLFAQLIGKMAAATLAQS